MGLLSLRYGRSGAAVLLGNFGSLFLFQGSDPESAEWGQKTIGDIQVERTVENQGESESADRRSGSRGVSRQRVIEPAVLSSEILDLHPLHCYMRLPERGWSAEPTRVDYVPRPKTGAPFFDPADPEIVAESVGELRSDKNALESLERMAWWRKDNETDDS